MEAFLRWANRLPEWVVYASVVLILLLGVAAAVAISIAATYGCHRHWGPWLTGTNDPVAVAVYCRGGSIR